MMYASEGYTQAVEGFSHTADLDFLAKAAAGSRNFIDIVALPGFTEMDTWFDNPKYQFGEYNNKLKLQACKITLDGSPQGKTALVSHPYLTGGPDQRVDAYTALQALTTGPAWQIFEENRKGKIKQGFLADFVILQNNPLKQKVSEIRDNEVLATIKEGKLIYINTQAQ